MLSGLSPDNQDIRAHFSPYRRFLPAEYHPFTALPKVGTLIEKLTVGKYTRVCYHLGSGHEPHVLNVKHLSDDDLFRKHVTWILSDLQNRN